MQTSTATRTGEKHIERAKKQTTGSQALKRASSSPGTSQVGKDGACAEGRAGVSLCLGDQGCQRAVGCRRRPGKKRGRARFCSGSRPSGLLLRVLLVRAANPPQDPRLRSSHPAGGARIPLGVVLDGRLSTRLIGSRRLPNVKQKETEKDDGRIRGLSLAACQGNRRPCPASWPGWSSRLLVS